MIMNHRIAVGDAQLDEVDERVMVCGIEEPQVAESITTATRFGGVGQRVTGQHRETLDVIVKFALRQKKDDLMKRQLLFNRVVAWAMAAKDGAWITVGHRPGQRLRARLYQLPALGEPAEWNGEYSITFRAYGVPHWQEAAPVELTVKSTKNTSKSLTVDGTADTVVNVKFENLSGMKIETATIQAGSSKIALKSLSLMAQETLVIDHSAEGLLRIRIRSASGSYRSAMAARTEESADDLWVSPGKSTISFTAQRAGKLTVSCYGRWM